MTEHRDPLDALRADVVPVEPEAAFAARLRARLESALLNPRGATMSANTSPAPVTVPHPAPDVEGEVAYASLWLPDAARAGTFYPAVLGWAPEQAGPDRLRMDTLTPPMGIAGGVADATLFLCHTVGDLAAAIERVRAAGGQAGPPRDEPYGRTADCVDNQGVRLALLELERPGDTRPAPGPGELLYLTVEVPDSAAYREFYGSLFGWTFEPGRVADGWQVTGPYPMTGMRGGAGRPVIVPMYGVADINAAVAAVRASGGTATEPERQPYGTTADCADDQGTRFYLGQV